MNETPRPSQCALMLERLSDGRLHSTVELNQLGVGRPNSRSSELEHRHGYRIVCEYVRGAEGARAYQYRLLAAPASSLHGLEAQLSPGALSALDRFRISPADTSAAHTPRATESPRPVEGRKPEEAGGFQSPGGLDAQAGPAKQGPDLHPVADPQLSLDELAALEGEAHHHELDDHELDRSVA